MQNSTTKSWILDISILLVVYMSFYLGASYFRPISNPDEGRYAEIPREMIEQNDYITPRLNGLPYFYKPPLFYWFQCASFKCFGINRTSIRLANTLMAVIGICLTYASARNLYGRRAGWFCAVILSTSILYYAIASMTTLDMSVSVFISAAIFSFIVAICKSGIFRSILFCLFFVFCGLAVMTKGLIGILIPSAVIFLFLILGGKNRITDFFKSLSKYDIIGIISGIIMFVIICVPWHVAVSMANPSSNASASVFTSNPSGQGFFWYYFIHEHFLRYIDASTSMRSQPFWFFLIIAPAGFIPWLFLLPHSLKNTFKSSVYDKTIMSLMIVWVVFIIAFFSISSSKLVPYITAIYPPLAFIVGVKASQAYESKNLKLKPECIFIIAVGFLATIAIIVAYLILSRRDIEDDVKNAGFYGAIISSTLMFIVSVIALISYKKNKMKTFWITTFIGSAIFASSININAAMAQKVNSEKIAKHLQAVANKNIAIAFDYGAFHDLPVWLNKTLMFIGNPPEEQQFGWQIQKHKHKHRILSTPDALKNFLQKEDLIIVLKQKDISKLKSYNLSLSTNEIARNKNIIALKVSLNEK